MNNLEKGMKFANEGKMLKFMDLHSTNPKQRKRNLEWLKQFVTYEKTGKMSRGNMTNEIVITEVSNIPEKEDGRKQGNHTGHYKYYEEFKQTMLWLMRDWEIGVFHNKYMKNIMTETGAVSDKFFELKFTEESDIRQLQYRRGRIKNIIVRKGLERMAKEGLIDYKKGLLIIDCEDEERDAYDFEMNKHEVVEKEVLEEMGYNGFEELERKDILYPKEKIMHKFNDRVEERMNKIYGWKKIKFSRIRLVKNTDLKGSDMRKQINDKVVATYKQYVENKNKDFLDELYESLCASEINAGREDKLMERYEEPYKDILSDAMEDDRLEKLQEIARKEEKMKAYESFKQEDIKPMENSYYEFDQELYTQAKRTEDKSKRHMTVFGEMMCANRNDSNDNEDDDVVFEFK